MMNHRHFRLCSWIAFGLCFFFSLTACGEAAQAAPAAAPTEAEEAADSAAEDKLSEAMELLSEDRFEAAYSLLYSLGEDEQVKNSCYERGVQAFESGRYEEATELLSGLNYRDSEHYLSLISSAELSVALAEAQVGDTVVLGVYDQDAKSENGEEPIEWRVLDISDGNMLLISRYSLECVDFADSRQDTSWQDSHLKRWLNEEFYVNAFSDAEKNIILPVNTETEEYTVLNAPSNSDRVFVLSTTEVLKYFRSDFDRVSFCTVHDIFSGAWSGGDRMSRWWLRSDGCIGERKAGVRHNGSVFTAGYYVDIGYLSVRPCICISPIR